jgi:hypothetical protein
MHYYWRIRTKPPSSDTYIRTNQRHIPEMVVDIAIRSKMFLECFVDVIETVKEVSKEEYYEHMWE